MFPKPYLVNLISKDTHLVFSIYCYSEVVSGVSNVLPAEDKKMEELKKQHEKAKKLAEKEAAAKLGPTEGEEAGLFALFVHNN